MSVQLLGILNVTPDSFSDGGLFYELDAAVAHGLRLAEEGADIVDVGGESTRPGAAPVPPEEELRRVLPVVRDLTSAGIAVSIDTRHALVADAAVAAIEQAVAQLVEAGAVVLEHGGVVLGQLR